MIILDVQLPLSLVNMSDSLACYDIYLGILRVRLPIGAQVVPEVSR